MPATNYKTGDLFIGADNKGRLAGISTKRHALTFAGSRSGKGAACIIPNLKRWPHNSLTIDPKGEAAIETAADRERMGQSVHVIEPFQEYQALEKYRASYNPMDELNVNSLTISADINVIAEGLMMRHDPKHGRWDNKAKLIIAGLIGFVKTQAPEEQQNLIEVRTILRTSDMATVADSMINLPECDGLMQAAAAAIKSPDGKDFIDTAQANTEWLDVKAFAACMSHSDFSMFDLKTKQTSIYLVLPPDYLDEYGRFLRLFVRVALSQMGKKNAAGQLLDQRCLFILDEFFSLGTLSIIQKAAGQMPGMGVHLWPFLQDLGQLTALYGQDGAQTFFGNSDLHQFFGNTDHNTLEYMSRATGKVGVEELPIPPAAPATAIAGANHFQGDQSAWGQVMGTLAENQRVSTAKTNAKDQERYQNEMNHYQQAVSRLNTPRITFDEMADKVKLRDDVVADNMFCVLHGSENQFFKPLPYFRDNTIKKNASGSSGTSENLIVQWLKNGWDSYFTKGEDGRLSWAKSLFASFIGIGLIDEGLRLIGLTGIKYGAFLILVALITVVIRYDS